VRSRLNTADAPKERVRATLALLEERLARVESETAANHSDAATADLGVYQALLEDMMLYLKPVGRSPDGRKVDGPTRDLYKHIELALNKHTARIEAVRRQTPEEYQHNVRDAFFYVRDKRTECLDSFFGANVLREPTAPKQNGATTKPPGQLDE
jgi:hypothetical protein